MPRITILPTGWEPFVDSINQLSHNIGNMLNQKAERKFRKWQTEYNAEIEKEEMETRAALQERVAAFKADLAKAKDARSAQMAFEKHQYDLEKKAAELENIRARGGPKVLSPESQARGQLDFYKSVGLEPTMTPSADLGYGSPQAMVNNPYNPASPIFMTTKTPSEKELLALQKQRLDIRSKEESLVGRELLNRQREIKIRSELKKLHEPKKKKYSGFDREAMKTLYEGYYSGFSRQELETDIEEIGYKKQYFKDYLDELFKSESRTLPTK